MNRLKKGFMVVTVSGLLLGGAGFVAAQQESTTQTNDVLAQAQRGLGSRDGASHRGRGSRGDAAGLPLGRFSLGTTVELSFYNGDPESGGTAQSTLTHVVGEDSEVAFAEAFQAAREGATHMTISVSEQSRTLDLEAMRERSETRGGRTPLGRLAGAGLNRLNEDSTVSATFYDGDPEAGGNTLQSLSFAYGVDSARGFTSEFADAAEDAAFVTVTTSPQERTVDLSSVENLGQERVQGRRGFGRTR